MDKCPCCQKFNFCSNSWLCNDCKLHRESCTVNTEDTVDTIDTVDTVDTIVDKFWKWYDKHIIK